AMGTHLLTTTAMATALLAATSSARAAAYGRGRARLRPLLASTSLAALLVGVGTPAAFAQTVPCTGGTVTSTVDNLTNDANVTTGSCSVSGPTGIVNNNVTNHGVLNGFNGINVTNGAVVGNGISNANTGTIIVGLEGINVDRGAVVAGGISNAGTIS